MHPAEHVSLGTMLRAAEHLWLPGGPCADIVMLGFVPDDAEVLCAWQFQVSSVYASQEFTLPWYRFFRLGPFQLVCPSQSVTLLLVALRVCFPVLTVAIVGWLPL